LQTVIYQTLEDRGNPDDVVKHGPYKCTHSNAYVGPGYYFWDNDLHVAHLWGQRRIKSAYMIFSAELSMQDQDLLDLYYSKDDRDFLQTIVTKFDLGGQKLGKIFYFLQKKNEETPTKGVFPYKAIRIQDNNFGDKTYFADGKHGFTNFNPAIMICLVDKRKVHLNGFDAIYPEKYI
jgi:hypothetical protein